MCNSFRKDHATDSKQSYGWKNVSVAFGYTYRKLQNRGCVKYNGKGLSTSHVHGTCLQVRNNVNATESI